MFFNPALQVYFINFSGSIRQSGVQKATCTLASESTLNIYDFRRAISHYFNKRDFSSEQDKKSDNSEKNVKKSLRKLESLGSIPECD